MPTITITLIDPDFDYSLPARWGTDYKVSAIQGCFLNGATALVLSLSPLKDENLPEFSQGRSPIPFDLRRISFPN
jgi:hypothetical protein